MLKKPRVSAFGFCYKAEHTEVMKTFNQTVANHPQLESILIPIGDGVTEQR